MKNIAILLIIVTILINCENEKNRQRTQTLLFPIGRYYYNNSLIRVSIGDQPYIPEVFYDSCGGYWFRIPRTDNPNNEMINITINRKAGDLDFFNELSENSDWLSSSFYIDANDATIMAKSSELTVGLTTNIAKAQAIQQFVIHHVEREDYKNSFLDKASKTYQLGYGTCMNFSRLYVALCRAAGIPARTIWGIVYGYNNDHVYDYHHQWAEIQDEEGYWHSSDFNYTTMFNLNDIRYLDLIYAAEENAVILNRDTCSLMFDNLKYYKNYPVTLNARLGFQLKNDNRPDSMVVEFFY